MHAYMLTDDEAFNLFCAEAGSEIYSRCECEHDTGWTCEDCTRLKEICERHDIDVFEYLNAVARAKARRKMRRRRVDSIARSRQIEKAKAAHAALGYGIAPASCIPDHILHKD